MKYAMKYVKIVLFIIIPLLFHCFSLVFEFLLWRLIPFLVPFPVTVPFR